MLNRKRVTFHTRSKPKVSESIPDLVGSLTAYRPAMQTYRYGKYLHMSDLLGRCIRQIALCERMHIPVPQRMVTRQVDMIVYAQGNAIHDYVKGVLSECYPDNAFGDWVCECRSSKLQGMVYSEAKNYHCTVCGNACQIYSEMMLTDDIAHVSGSPDMVMKFGDKHFPIEIKSKSADLFAKCTAPEPDHILQVTSYWRLMHTKKMIVDDASIILYVSKDWTPKKAIYKQFNVTPSEHEPRLTDYFLEATALKNYANSGVLPRRIACSSIDCKRALYCPVKDDCFREE